MLKIIETGFDGLILIIPRMINDERGGFYESWHLKSYQKISISETFLQDDISISKKNVLRGLHFQRNQGQLVTVTYGKIFDVVVDIRPESKTYKKYFAVELDANEPKQIYMSPGFAHGFCVLSDLAVVHYKCTQYYDPNQEVGVAWNDPEIGIKWPVNNPNISFKDLNYKNISLLIQV